MKGSLISAGFIPHRDKSIWYPTQILTWLGFVIDLIKGLITCTDKRLQAAQICIQEILKTKQTKVKTLAKIKGMIISMERSHGEIVYLRTRFLSLAVAEAPTWGCNVTILPPVEQELLFWQKHLLEGNGSNLFASIESTQISFTDASGTGCATICSINPLKQKVIVNRTFSSEEAATSSTERELLAVLHGLIELKELLQGCSVNWHTDSKNVARISKRGSMKPYLLNLAVAIFQVAKKHKITLNVIWVPRTENKEADLWSRVQDFNDWGIHPSYVKQICAYFKVVPTIDRFADNKNKKCKRFNSRFYHKESEAVDCFSQN